MQSSLSTSADGRIEIELRILVTHSFQEDVKRIRKADSLRFYCSNTKFALCANSSCAVAWLRNARVILL